MQRQPIRTRAARAFTLVEAAISATVMAMVIAGAIGVIQSGFRAMDNARNTTLAAQIIQSEMERIRLLNWSEVSALGASSSVNLDDIFPSDDSITASLRSRFTAARSCTTVSGTDDEMKSITITVTWTGIDKISHSRSTTTYYCKNGLYDYYYTLANG